MGDLDYVNDEDDDEEVVKTTTRPPPEPSSSRKSPNVPLSFGDLLTMAHQDYFVAFCLLVLVALVFLFVSALAFLYLCRKCAHSRSQSKQKRRMDTLKVKNYRELELMNSSNSSGNISSGNNSGTVETDRDDDHLNEIHTLLDNNNHHHHHSNHSSASNTSNSHLIFARESSTTVSSMCHSSASSQMEEAAAAVSAALTLSNPGHHQSKFAPGAYMQQGFSPNGYSNTLKPRMCNDYVGMSEKKALNCRTLASHSNLMKVRFRKKILFFINQKKESMC